MPKPVTKKPLLQALAGDALHPPPFWFMRQAGRYLPEYRSVRAGAGSFLDLCFTPDLATEVTLQPVRRFGMDAAILFSDILVVPHGLGQRVTFEEGRGPVLDAVRSGKQLARLEITGLRARLSPVYETVRQVRTELPADVALIGFAGAPWTVASYMVEGGTSRDFSQVKAWAYADPEGFGRLIDLLVEATAEHLLAQIEAGAEAVQLFDSWVGVLPEPELARWGLEPTRSIVAKVKAARPDVPVIVFPRGAGLSYARYAERCGIDALGLDTTVSPLWAKQVLQPRCAVQGNLDPVHLVTGGQGMRTATETILQGLGAGPFVFNLGHGVLPQTPPEHVAELCELLRGWRGNA